MLTVLLFRAYDAEKFREFHLEVFLPLNRVRAHAAFLEFLPFGAAVEDVEPEDIVRCYAEPFSYGLT